MYRRLAILAAIVSISPTGGRAEESDSGKGIAYAPDVVGVGRLFMVALNVPVETGEVTVTAPESVTLLDKTRLPAKGELRKFYFRALTPAKKAEIRFAVSGREVVVPVEIWSFEDLNWFRTLKGAQLPRRWPLGQRLPELKQSQTVTTGAIQASFQGSKAGAQWADTPDETIWAMQPDSTIPRWHWVNLQFGCPVHGTQIYQKTAYYPWVKDSPIPWPWRIQCPTGGEMYPSNAFGSGDMTSGDFTDDGIGGGYIAPDGKHYGFIAELAQHYCHRMLRVPIECAEGHLATGDVKLAHKALVALSRLAVEYAYLATMTHHRHRNSAEQVERLGQGRFDEGPCLDRSGFTVYCISQPGYQADLAEAYDRIFPAIDRDPEILPFLQQQGFPLKSHEDVRRFIEENLFAVWAQGTMDGACASNQPGPQAGLARLAEVLNYERGTDFMDWLYDGNGQMRTFVTNGFFRDGSPFESTGGYNTNHVVDIAPIVDSIEHLRTLRPDLYPQERYPSFGNSGRYRAIFDFEMESVTIDRSYPQIGDDGGHTSYWPMGKRTTQSGGRGRDAFERAYRVFSDPKLAWALANDMGWQPSPGFPLSRGRMEQEAAKCPADWNDKSSLLDGYGIAILRSGKGDDKRALWMYYGTGRGHSQDDLLDIGLQAYQGTLLSHMGYPRNWGYWEYSWTSHNVARQFPYATMTAQAQLFADAGPVQVAEARAQGYSDGVAEGSGITLQPDTWQRRLLALVDAGPDRFYGVDLYRNCGGEQHWWALHGPEGEFTTRGIALTKQEKGTLAGPDVPYGDTKWLKENGCEEWDAYGLRGTKFGFAHLYNVERGKPDGVWSADWAVKNGSGLHLRLTIADAGGSEVAISDGTSPAGGHPYEMKWIMLHSGNPAPNRTQVLSLIEPYTKEPVIKGVQPLSLSGDDESGFAAKGCVVQLDGRTDYILASASPQVRRTAGGLRFAGRFGLYSETEGEPVQMVLIGGTALRKGQFGISLRNPDYRARITRVDRATETVTLAPAPPRPEAMAGATIFITNSDRRIAYKVRRAKRVAGGVQLQLHGDSRIGVGKVSGVVDYGIKTPTAFPLQYYRYYHGARLINAAGSAEYRLLDVRSANAAFIDPAASSEAKAARLQEEFPAGSGFEVFDYGVGDEVVWPYTVTVVRTGSKRYRIAAPVAVRLAVPEGAMLEGQDGGTVHLRGDATE